MSDSQESPWSDNPNAPNISYSYYLAEKSFFAGILLSSILYGIVIVLSFQSMTALFDPIHHKGKGIKWGLVSYTAVVFLLATVQTALNLDVQSISYINNREFPGINGQIAPGPLGYQTIIYAEALSVVPYAMLALSNWLADGLLLYRCYFIYSGSAWVIVFPCFMYLGSVAMGIIFVYQATQPSSSSGSVTIPYFSISLSLNILLTVMIIIRLTLHARGIRTAMGETGSGGLCKAIVTMFIESCAINAVTSLLLLILYGAKNGAVDVFTSILAETQVIAPLFIIHRVANKTALTSKSLVSGRMSTFKARSRGELTDGGAIPSGDPANPVDERGMSSSEPGVGVETTNDSYREEVF